MGQVGVERIFIEDLVKFGEDQGLQQGLQQGEARALLKLVTQRFGPVSEAIEKRVRSASEAELDRWLERVLTVASLEGVFAE